MEELDKRPLFSIVAITKNGAKTLPRLFQSIKEFIDLGGEAVIVSTGSTDKTEEICVQNGAKFYEVGEKFIKVIDAELANSINTRFVVGDEEKIVLPNAKLFDFGSARNYAASLATNDFIITVDDDEFLEVNIEKVNDLIRQGYEQFEYNFVFAFSSLNQFGTVDRNCRRAVEFTQSKSYDRRKMSWVGIVHENLFGNTKRIFLDEDTLFLGHHQEQGKPHRGQYIVGLAYACYHEDNDRNAHYLSRECLYTGRYNSALEGFQRHINMRKWPAERAQSMIYCGDICKIQGKVEEATNWYLQAFNTDSGRREALIKLAQHCLDNKNFNAAIVYATGSLQLGPSGYYADERSYYRDVPHSIIYKAAGFAGNIGMAQHHLMECLRYEPYNQEYLRDTKFYFEYPDNGIEGWMRFEELQFLYNEAQKHDVIVEGGSWKSKSANALASGLKKRGSGTLTCCDTWLGSIDVRDDTNWMAKQEDIFAIFKENTKQFDNIKTIRKSSVEAAKDFPDGSIDFMFIDMGHDFDSVVEDLRAWKSKVRKGGVLAGHDWVPNSYWMSVCQAVRQEMGEEPHEIHDSIWVYRM